MNKKFVQNLKLLRNQLHLTQDNLAKELQLSRSTITKYETGEREPDFETLEKLSDFFSVSIDFLLGRTQANYSISERLLKQGVSLKNGEAIKPEYLSDECVIEAAKVIAKGGTVLNQEEKSFLLNMIKTYIASVENEKRKGSGKKESPPSRKTGR